MVYPCSGGQYYSNYPSSVTVNSEPRGKLLAWQVSGSGPEPFPLVKQAKGSVCITLNPKDISLKSLAQVQFIVSKVWEMRSDQ